MSLTLAATMHDHGSIKYDEDEGQGLAGGHDGDGSFLGSQQQHQRQPVVQQPLLNPLYLAHQAAFARDEKLNVFVGSGGLPGGMFYE